MKLKEVLKSGTKQYLVIGVTVIITTGVLGLSQLGTSESSQGKICGEEFESIDNSEVEDWQEFKLVDINSCETYKISELEKPVLVETFAVWCPTCTNQQREVKKYHEDSGITSVSLDVDTNEEAKQVRDHTDENGFNWRYSIAPSKMTRSLIEEYGNSIATPPRAPMILVCEDGTRRLPDNIKPESKLREEVEKGCQT